MCELSACRGIPVISAFALERWLPPTVLPRIPVIHNTTLCANLDWVRDNEDLVRRYLKALIEAIHFFKTEKERTCAILERELAPLIGLQGADEVFLLGDTADSFDSRYWGPVRLTAIDGVWRPLF